jgi:hypothetical protein
MSQIVASIGTELFVVAKEYGVRRVAKHIFEFSSFLLPFTFWMYVYLLLGKNFFVPLWPWFIIIVVGLLFSMFQILFALCYATLLIDIPKSLMRKVQDTPNNERKSIAMSFLYLPVLNFFGHLNFPSQKRDFIGFIPSFLAPYSIVTFFAMNSGWLVQTFSPIYEPISQTLRIPQLSIPAFSLFLLCLFLLSLCYYVPFKLSSIRFCKENSIKIPRRYILSTPVLLFLMPSQILVYFFWIARAIYSLTASRTFMLVYQPFVVSSDIPKIVQKAFENIQGKECVIYEYKYQIKTEREVEALKRETKKHFVILTYFYDFINVDTAGVIDIITKEGAVLYLGFLEEQCAFVGKVFYSTAEKTRQAYFYFNNQYVRGEFEAIIGKEIDKAHEI